MKLFKSALTIFNILLTCFLLFIFSQLNNGLAIDLIILIILAIIIFNLVDKTKRNALFALVYFVSIGYLLFILKSAPSCPLVAGCATMGDSFAPLGILFYLIIIVLTVASVFNIFSLRLVNNDNRHE